jgi:hypothetical protein
MKFAQTQEAHEFLLSIYYYSLSILLLHAFTGLY